MQDAELEYLVNSTATATATATATVAVSAENHVDSPLCMQSK